MTDADKEFISDPAFKARFRSWAADLDSRSRSRLSPFLFSAYRIRQLRKLCARLLRRLEGGEMSSRTLRRILRDYHGVIVGDYSYGACMEPGLLPPGTIVGNYCSTAEGLRVLRRNHPATHLSQHPYFYNKKLGLVPEDTIQSVADNLLHIGHDVWVGAGVTILPGCRRIGDGAIVGAGAVVTRDIEPFSIYAGNPARRIGQRFSNEMREHIEKSRWWLFPLAELSAALPLLCAPVTEKALDEFMNAMEGANGSSDQIH